MKLLAPHPHGVWILVGEEGQQSCEAAEPRREQYEERKFLLWVDRHLKRCFVANPSIVGKLWISWTRPRGKLAKAPDQHTLYNCI